MKRDLERHLRIQPLLKNKNSLDIRIKATTKVRAWRLQDASLG